MVEAYLHFPISLIDLAVAVRYCVALPDGDESFYPVDDTAYWSVIDEGVGWW